MAAVEIKTFQIDEENQIASLILNRPEQANAFNADILDSLIEKLDELRKMESIRVLLLQSRGKHFSAGADLNWMKASSKLSKKENLADATRLTRMFESLLEFPRPSIAIVKGASYGGAVGLSACCDYAVSLENARFSLSEVRIGLIPAVIMPYLARKINHVSLRRLALSGRVFSSQEAKNYGLISESFQTKEQLNDWLILEIEELLKASPQAQAACKELLTKLCNNAMNQGEFTAEAIANIRTSETAQLGLKAFLEKTSFPWQAKLDPCWLIED